jgi:endonuclease/exonuclease/phosphatase family metal-dependent hydrolase
MSYNVENLFDDVYDGTEYPEFDPRGGKWTTEMFLTRIDTVAEVIRRAVPGGPDIVALQEVENENALKTLADRGLRGLGYTRAILVPNRGAATNVGILTRMPVSRVHSSWVTARTSSAARDILEIEILHGDLLLHVFNNHWKSKTEGARETEGSRINAARTLAERVREILEQNPAADIIAAGDLNEAMDEFARASGKYRTALMPIEAGVSDEYGLDGMLLTSIPPQTGMTGGHPVFYDPWGETAEGARGSYFYRGAWETVDHILMTGGLFDSLGFSYSSGSFRVYREPFLLLPGGAPMKWEGTKGRRGYSDHLPLLLTLEIHE